MPDFEIVEHEHEGVIEKFADLHPIPVKIVKGAPDDEVTRVEGAQYASFHTYQIQGTDPMQRLIAQDLRRKRCTIVVTPGLTAANVLGYVKIGPREVVNNRQGALLVSGNTIVMEHGREVWIIGDNAAHELTVSVIDERYGIDNE